MNSFGMRSEERRVGEECRSRWSADHQKEFEAMESQLEEKDDIATETTNAIIQFAVTTIKALGYEYIKSRIGF